jgi:hypothetical protein
MGDVGQTLLGGSNQSQNSNSTSGNNAYPFLSGALSPSVNYLPSGGNYLGTLLGIPGYGSAPTANTPMPTQAPVTQPYNGPTMAQINAMKNDGIPGNYRAALAAYQSQPRQTAAAAPLPASTAAPSPVTSANQTGALQTFADSAGMKFLSDNANRAIDNNQAAKGLLQSGSTLKGIADYNKGLDSQYLNDYLDRVMGFSKLGGMAASTLAGAGAYSNGTSSGSGSSKNGLLPTLVGGAQAYASGGGKF